MTPQEFAERLRAKLTLPSDPKRPRDIFAKTDVRKTWELFSKGQGCEPSIAPNRNRNTT